MKPTDVPFFGRSRDAPVCWLRISLDPAVVGKLLAESMTAMTPVEPLLLDGVTSLVVLLDSPQDVVPLAPLVLREITYCVLLANCWKNTFRTRCTPTFLGP